MCVGKTLRALRFRRCPLPSGSCSAFLRRNRIGTRRSFIAGCGSRLRRPFFRPFLWTSKEMGIGNSPLPEFVLHDYHQLQTAIKKPRLSSGLICLKGKTFLDPTRRSSVVVVIIGQSICRVCVHDFVKSNITRPQQKVNDKPSLRHSRPARHIVTSLRNRGGYLCLLHLLISIMRLMGWRAFSRMSGVRTISGDRFFIQR